MDTNSNISLRKKVVGVEILHLDQLGYGPKGIYTRSSWREMCQKMLLVSKTSFATWESSILRTNENYYETISFGYRLKYEDGTFESKGLDKKHSCTLDFTGNEFEALHNPEGYEFQLNACFSAAIFKGIVWCDKTVFHELVDFIDTRFIGSAWFEGAKFQKITRFDGAIFNKYANFDSSSFNNYAVFVDATFVEGASFRKTLFLGHTTFRSVNFFQGAGFANATFNDSVGFSAAVFKSSADFSRTHFKERCRFDGKEVGAIFESNAYFENAIFANVGHFEGVIFKTSMPDFRGCKIDATRLEFSEKSKFPIYDFQTGAIENVSFLKRLSDEHGQTDQALRFNAIELRLKRLSTTNDFSFKVVTWIYEKLSDYGRSFMRPIYGYLGLLVISALCAMTYSTYSDSPAKDRQVFCKQMDGQPPPLKLSYERAVFEYAMFRAGGLMDFTDTGKQNNAVNCRLFEEPIEPPLMRAWGVFKGIVSIALLFLAALGLRNKYRIK